VSLFSCFCSLHILNINPISDFSLQILSLIH
jgi:hypothetical protein